MPVSRRLIFATAVHGVFSQFGDVLASCLNLLNDPIRNMFNGSIHKHYGLIDNNGFEWIYASCASTMMLGLLLGFMSMGHLMDYLGRKETGVVLRCYLGIIAASAMVMSFTTGSFELYVFGHFVGGIIAALKVVLLIYLAECSPDNMRGFTSMVVNSGGVVVVLVLTPVCLPAIIGTDDLWFILPFISGFMAVVHLLIASKFPQSPKQLYVQEHREIEARAAFAFYFGDHCDVDDAIREIEAERICETHMHVSIMDIIRNDSYRFSFFLVLLCAFAPTISALNLKLQFLHSWLTTYGLSSSEATSAMLVISVVSIPLCFVAPSLIERCGRRNLFTVITVLCAVEWAAFGLAQFAIDKHNQAGTFFTTFINNNPQACKLLFTSPWVYAVFGATMGQCAVNLGLLIMAPVMISEVCPHNTRASISQFSQALPAAVGLIEVVAFPNLRAVFGAGMYLVLAVCCGSVAVILRRMMLETAGIPVDRIVRRIHSVRSRGNSMFSDILYGSTNHDCTRSVSMHHDPPPQ